jgi:hypothetical protein
MLHMRNTIPELPPPFRCDALVEVGLALYADAISLPHHALKFSFAFLTLIEDHYGDQPRAARALKVDNATLTEFKDLSSRGGEGVAARKATKRARLALTAERTVWLMRVFRELIQRHGKIEASAPSQEQFAELCPGPSDDFPDRQRRS